RQKLPNPIDCHPRCGGPLVRSGDTNQGRAARWGLLSRSSASLEHSVAWCGPTARVVCLVRASEVSGAGEYLLPRRFTTSRGGASRPNEDVRRAFDPVAHLVPRP